MQNITTNEAMVYSGSDTPTASTKSASSDSESQCRVIIDSKPMATTPKERRVATSLDLSVNRGLVLLPEYQAKTDWSGALTPTRGTNARNTALKIVERARMITEKLDVGRGKDQSDESWDPRVPVLEVTVNYSELKFSICNFSRCCLQELFETSNRAEILLAFQDLAQQVHYT